MKTLLSFFLAAFICVSAFAVEDVAYIANWKLPIKTWYKFTEPAGGLSAIVAGQAYADTVAVAGFDAATSNFDNAWDAISGNGYAIGSTTANINGLVASDHGAADFSGSYKVLFDEFNMYILLKYTDDDIKGTETVEVAWSQEYKNEAIAALAASKSTFTSHGYNRYYAFGGEKVAFTTTAFKNAWLIKFDAGGTASMADGTDAGLAANLFIDNRGATTGAGVVKQVITIGYPALTGEQRPNFDQKIWRTLNGGKGISFDLKVVDIDSDDALNTATTPVPKPAEYWWNAINNDGYAVTWYSGYLAPRLNTGFKTVNASSNIFGKMLANKVEMNEFTNVLIFTVAGKQVREFVNVNVVDMSDLSKGVYILRAKGQTFKVIL